MGAVTQMCYVFFHLLFNVSPIQKWVWVWWLHIGTGDNYARHAVLWFRRSTQKVKGVEVFIKQERNVSYATVCRARNPLLHWQKCRGCYFLCLVGNFDGLLTNLKECAVLGKCPSKHCVLSPFSWHLPAVFHVIICDNLMNSNLPHPHVPAPRVIQRQISSLTRQDSSVTASLHQPSHNPQASLNLFSLHNCKYSLSCFSLSPCLGPLSLGTRWAFCWSKTPGNSHAVQNEPWLSPQSTCTSFRNKVSYVHPDQLNIIKM